MAHRETFRRLSLPSRYGYIFEYKTFTHASYFLVAGKFLNLFSFRRQHFRSVNHVTPLHLDPLLSNGRCQIGMLCKSTVVVTYSNLTIANLHMRRSFIHSNERKEKSFLFYLYLFAR